MESTSRLASLESWSSADQADYTKGGLRAQPLLGRPRRVVIAEDDDEFREILVEAFEDAGFDVLQCADGGQLAVTLHAIFDNEDDSIHAVITDIRMPEFTGLDILIGAREVNQVLPFVLITAFGDEATHERARNFGAITVDKPFDVDDLVALVSGLPGETLLS